MRASIRPVEVGDPITADLMNQIVDAANRSRISVATGCSGMIMSEGPGGTSIGVSIPATFTIRLTSNSGASFAWTLVWAAAGGTWTDGPQSGTTSSDPAIEINGNTSVTLPAYVQAWRAGGQVLFQIGTC